MRLIILDEQGGEKMRTNINDIIFTADGEFQVRDENDFLSDVSETIDEAIASLVSKINT